MNHIVTKEENDVRLDIRERFRQYMIEDMKPKFDAIAKQQNCDHRAVKRAYKEAKQNNIGSLSDPKAKAKRPCKLDPFRENIDEKLNIRCSAMAMYKFIEKHGLTSK